MPFRIERAPEADAEFLALPPLVRETMFSAFTQLEPRFAPTLTGEGWHIEELRQRRRVIRGGLFSLHAGPVYRGLFGRRGPVLKFLAFGAHIPEDDVYRRLDRAREAFQARPTRSLGRPAESGEALAPTVRRSMKRDP